MGDNKSLADHVRDVEREYPDSDVIAYLGPIARPFDDEFISLCDERGPLRKNLILILSTLGGDTDAAYRIARCIQRRWGLLPAGAHYGHLPNVSVFVDTVCASAGTLLALGATKLIMSDNAELRPLDIQPRKSDDASDQDIGLTADQAMDILERRFKGLFKEYRDQLKPGGELDSTRAAVEMASSVTTGLLATVYDQLDPGKFAATERQMQTVAAYGERLAKYNLKPGALARLLTSYPSPRFIIDRSEAEELFHQVVLPKPALAGLGEHLRRASRAERQAVMFFLTGPLHTTKPAPDEAPLQPVATVVTNGPAETVEPAEPVREVERVAAAPKRPVVVPQIHAKRGSIEEKIAAVWHKEIYS
jgi:hypothetical protein